MQEDRIKVADNCKFVTLIFSGIWNQVSELHSSLFSPQPPTPNKIYLFSSVLDLS